jgi:hypothetical protein
VPVSEANRAATRPRAVKLEFELPQLRLEIASLSGLLVVLLLVLLLLVVGYFKSSEGLGMVETPLAYHLAY